jgi:hypothetical protein
MHRRLADVRLRRDRALGDHVAEPAQRVDVPADQQARLGAIDGERAGAVISDRADASDLVGRILVREPRMDGIDMETQSS